MQRVVDAGTTGFGAAEIKVLSQWVVVRHDRNNCPESRDCHLTIVRWDGRRHSSEIGLRIGKNPAHGSQVDQRQHRDDNGGGERRLREVGQQRRQEQCRERDANGGEHAGGRRLRSCV